MEAEQIGWFQPGSVSLSFVIFAIAAACAATVVALLVRYLSHRQPAHHH